MESKQLNGKTVEKVVELVSMEGILKGNNINNNNISLSSFSLELQEFKGLPLPYEKRIALNFNNGEELVCLGYVSQDSYNELAKEFENGEFELCDVKGISILEDYIPNILKLITMKVKLSVKSKI